MLIFYRATKSLNQFSGLMLFVWSSKHVKSMIQKEVLHWMFCRRYSNFIRQGCGEKRKNSRSTDASLVHRCKSRFIWNSIWRNVALKFSFYTTCQRIFFAFSANVWLNQNVQKCFFWISGFFKHHASFCRHWLRRKTFTQRSFRCQYDVSDGETVTLLEGIKKSSLYVVITNCDNFS